MSSDRKGDGGPDPTDGSGVDRKNDAGLSPERDGRNTACTPGDGEAERCDGVDNDCDELVDEGLPARRCGSNVGTCSPGDLRCTDGQETCDGAIEPSTELCDGREDEDCDGAIDDGCSCSGDSQRACGESDEGTCQLGEQTCVDGLWSECVGSVGSTDEHCDGLDNDCDGELDEAIAPTPTACGRGACLATGTMGCVDGALVDSCMPGRPASDDGTCDGTDDDCDGATDEDHAGQTTACGQGACAESGAMICVEGDVVDSCTPGSPASDDATCNGIDDDCDGATDEEHVGQSTSCGRGACAANGATTCVGGNVVNSCMPGTPAANDATCDGADEDCDGSADEDYASQTTNCGRGACAASGTTSCVDGDVADSCTPGTPAAKDTVCDGIDDDCDGRADEDYAPQPTSCGQGPCAATGTTKCVDGMVVDGCTPGAPAAADATCDAIDDDCDGTADEDYVGRACSCASGCHYCLALPGACLDGVPTAPSCECLCSSPHGC